MIPFIPWPLLFPPKQYRKDTCRGSGSDCGVNTDCTAECVRYQLRVVDLRVYLHLSHRMTRLNAQWPHISCWMLKLKMCSCPCLDHAIIDWFPPKSTTTIHSAPWYPSPNLSFSRVIEDQLSIYRFDLLPWAWIMIWGSAKVGPTDPVKYRLSSVVITLRTIDRALSHPSGV